MSEEKKPFVKAIESVDKIDPMVFEAEGSQVKVYVDKVGYPWEAGSKKGIAQRVRVSLAKLDSNGDIRGMKKQINFPAQLTEKDFEKIFKACVKASKSSLKAE